MGEVKHDHTISVTVQSGRGSRQFDFPQQTKVSDAAEQAALALGYPTGGAYLLVRLADNEELAGERTLISYHIEDGEILVVSVTGSGV